ncbi:hypothetical protein H6P81_001322 [Aristolochia fimbriata]|uniref:UspA domain-containing protein n=1 Tax=Aristolochia fimbriata TaxID=158543 RepID=A0AAV7F821_ARIFI|nr:hypothetical protein H6P81_001322 [Aristolochia fimbriata]
MEPLAEDVEEYSWREVKLPNLIPVVGEPELERETGERRRGRDVLIAIDHGPNSKHAFDWAMLHFCRLADTVHLVHAVSSVKTDVVYETTQVLMEKLAVEAFQVAMVRSVARIVEGDAGKAICREAERLKPVAVVMGSRGRGLIQSVFQGSVGEYCFHNCKSAPVIIVPGKGAGEESVLIGLPRGKHSGFYTLAGNDGGVSAADNEVEEAKDRSTMPERFRYLAKEAPDKPIRWPWFIVAFFLLYAWRAVAWELTNWKQVLFSIIGFVGYLLKLSLAVFFHYLGDPITSTIGYIESLFYLVRTFYTNIVAYAPVQELTTIILLSSTTLAIAETVVPNSISSKRNLITFAGILGYLVLSGSIPILLFWLLLLGIFYFSHFIKKEDVVSAALPVVSTAAAVGEPWLRGLVMALYLALAIIRHSKSSKEPKEAVAATNGKRVPLPLLWVGLAIGTHLAAKWARYRHLTWMIA